MTISLKTEKYKKNFRLIKKHPKKKPNLNKKLKKIFDFEHKKNRSNFLSKLSKSWLYFSIKGRKLSFNQTLIFIELNE